MDMRAPVLSMWQTSELFKQADLAATAKRLGKALTKPGKQQALLHTVGRGIRTGAILGAGAGLVRGILREDPKDEDGRVGPTVSRGLSDALHGAAGGVLVGGSLAGLRKLKSYGTKPTTSFRLGQAAGVVRHPFKAMRRAMGLE